MPLSPQLRQVSLSVVSERHTVVGVEHNGASPSRNYVSRFDVDGGLVGELLFVDRSDSHGTGSPKKRTTMFIITQRLTPLSRDAVRAELAKLSSSDRFDAAGIEAIYRAMVAARAEIYGEERLDANETMVLTKQLEYLRARTADVKRPDFKARLLVPVTSEVDPGAETWAYAQWDRAGMAKIVANYADDIPKVATFAKKFTQPIETLTLGYSWSWLDLQRTARAGVPLRSRMSQAVRDGFEQRIEVIAAIGIKETGVTGLLNNANVPVISAAPPVNGSLTAWDGGHKTPPEILSDLTALEDAVINNTKGVHTANTLVLPLTKYRFLVKTPYSTAAGARPTDTILSVFIQNSPTIKDVEWWSFADTASSGSGPRAMVYRRDPNIVHLEIPLEQQELPPQAKNLSLEINSVGRIGGVAFEYPLAAAYMDGI